MSGMLKVNTDELRTAGNSFTAAGERLANVKAEAPLGDAAAAVPGLQTAVACRSAQTAVAAEMSALAGGARSYGTKLRDAAGRYEQTDNRSGEQIRSVEVPNPSPR
ncbi:type VII secretion target [Mycobacterium sp. SMC-4]|uniref:type VII secretion target n=1 Tax=Mycobacterium sp. SMC-4 TaxID=2857059 RepID=UPI003D03F399